MHVLSSTLLLLLLAALATSQNPDGDFADFYDDDNTPTHLMPPYFAQDPSLLLDPSSPTSTARIPLLCRLFPNRARCMQYYHSDISRHDGGGGPGGLHRFQFVALPSRGLGASLGRIQPCAVAGYMSADGRVEVKCVPNVTTGSADVPQGSKTTSSQGQA